MIPKIIHYCWFGRNPLPEQAVKCIESWKKYFPDYEIKEWNESNFNVDSIPYTKDAYKARKYAFVSDYARFYILYKYGGVYFDTDVEVVKNMDEIIKKGPFMGREDEGGSGVNTVGVAPGLGLGVAPGLGLGVNPGLGLYKEILDYYDGISFINDNGSYNQTTVVQHVTTLLSRHGLKPVDEIQQCAGVYIYPKEYFCPLDYRTGKLNVTTNTYTIHHYMASWITKSQRIYKTIENIIGEKAAHKISAVLKYVKLFK